MTRAGTLTVSLEAGGWCRSARKVGIVVPALVSYRWPTRGWG
jgi:hypothetical protein